MDLIYTDAARKDQGVIFSSEFDLAYGTKENSFELTVDLTEHCCAPGSLLYIPGTEYGGIVDAVYVNADAGQLKYKGRTWHGILASKIIEPDAGDDYLELYGDAHAVMGELIDRMHVSDLFTVHSSVADIEIAGYQMHRYIDGYAGIIKMLQAADAKLQILWGKNRVQLSAVPIIDYSQDEEFNSAVNAVSMQVNYHPINHLICLGQGDLSQRAVIHLFTDENGGVQPYAVTDTPLQDSDYILNTSSQMLFGLREVSEVYDYGNAETTENYILLTVQPDDWSKKYTNYFRQNDSDDFTEVEGEDKSVYTVTNAQPADWAAHYSNFFTKSGSKYAGVQGVEKKSYKVLSKKPKDWSKNYKNYFFYYSDGITAEYKSAEALTKYEYKRHTIKPSDWDSAFENYFIKNKKGKFVKVDATGAPKWEKGKYYKKEKNRYALLTARPFDWNKKYRDYFEKKNTRYIAVAGIAAPKWKKGKYYTKLSKNIAPKWKKNHFYLQKMETTAPTWKGNTYFAKSEITICPAWRSGTFYRKVYDHYAELVAGGLERLTEAWGKDEIDITLDAGQAYDIGDIIGASEPTTGISVQKRIVKKIVKRNRLGDFEISYEVGESL